jgi:hypothetical protein
MWIWIWIGHCLWKLDLHWNMKGFMDIRRRRHDCLASRILHSAFRILSCLSRHLFASPAPFPFLFFIVSASTFVFDNVLYLGLFFSLLLVDVTEVGQRAAVDGCSK